MRGRHRRPKSNPFARGLAAFGAGGAALALPVIGATSAGAVTPQVAPKAVAIEKATVQTAKKAGPVTYSVIAGDSLSGIAQKYAMSGGWKKLYQDNRAVVGNDPAHIRPGLKLTINTKAAAGKATATERADRSARATTLSASAPAVQAAAPAKATTYANNLDGWIREALDIMKKNNIPGTYEGIHRNIMRESSGNPNAINNWDINAINGVPSIGLL
ncbi:LysM peptidoglycan-binding domain-containing protein, partial [Streptomyces sp. SP18CS02]|uniref:LysM peptidoglycan-binding domain-containing protein n=1 Tax=Streptomyces sp. SP18CS02 TaxID=3002531 RepID=UPI002E774E56